MNQARSHGPTAWASGRHRGPTPLGKRLGITCSYLGLGGVDFLTLPRRPCTSPLVGLLKASAYLGRTCPVTAIVCCAPTSLFMSFFAKRALRVSALALAVSLALANVAQTTAQNFFGTETPGTMRTLGVTHSSNFGCNVVSKGSNHSPPVRRVASDIRSVFPDRWVGALHPTVVSK